MVGSDGRASIRGPCDLVPYVGFVLSVLQSENLLAQWAKDIRLSLLKCALIVTIF